AALTVILLNSVGLVEVYYFMHMQPYDWRMLKPIIAGIVASLAALSLKRLIHVGYGLLALPALLALITLFTLIYISTLIVLRLNKEDKIVITTVCARLSGKRN